MREQGREFDLTASRSAFNEKVQRLQQEIRHRMASRSSSAPRSSPEAAAHSADRPANDPPTFPRAAHFDNSNQRQSQSLPGPSASQQPLSQSSRSPSHHWEHYAPTRSVALTDVDEVYARSQLRRSSPSPRRVERRSPSAPTSGCTPLHGCTRGARGSSTSPHSGCTPLHGYTRVSGGSPGTPREPRYSELSTAAAFGAHDAADPIEPPTPPPCSRHFAPTHSERIRAPTHDHDDHHQQQRRQWRSDLDIPGESQGSKLTPAAAGLHLSRLTAPSRTPSPGVDVANSGDRVSLASSRASETAEYPPPLRPKTATTPTTATPPPPPPASLYPPAQWEDHQTFHGHGAEPSISPSPAHPQLQQHFRFQQHGQYRRDLPNENAHQHHPKAAFQLVAPPAPTATTDFETLRTRPPSKQPQPPSRCAAVASFPDTPPSSAHAHAHTHAHAHAHARASSAARDGSASESAGDAEDRARRRAIVLQYRLMEQALSGRANWERTLRGAPSPAAAAGAALQDVMRQNVLRTVSGGGGAGVRSDSPAAVAHGAPPPRHPEGRGRSPLGHQPSPRRLPHRGGANAIGTPSVGGLDPQRMAERYLRGAHHPGHAPPSTTTKGRPPQHRATPRGSTTRTAKRTKMLSAPRSQRPATPTAPRRAHNGGATTTIAKVASSTKRFVLKSPVVSDAPRHRAGCSPGGDRAGRRGGTAASPRGRRDGAWTREALSPPSGSRAQPISPSQAFLRDLQGGCGDAGASLDAMFAAHCDDAAASSSSATAALSATGHENSPVIDVARAHAQYPPRLSAPTPAASATAPHRAKTENAPLTDRTNTHATASSATPCGTAPAAAEPRLFSALVEARRVADSARRGASRERSRGDSTSPQPPPRELCRAAAAPAATPSFVSASAPDAPFFSASPRHRSPSCRVYEEPDPREIDTLMENIMRMRVAMTQR